MIVVTGGAGFIGSNIVKALNERELTDIIVVDDLTDGTKFSNIADLRIADYIDKDKFLLDIKNKANYTKQIKTIFHEGACSTTTQWDGKFMMENNYEYTKTLLHYANDFGISLLYASSAAVYGGNKTFVEEKAHELPLNVYGYSKLLFDNYLRQNQAKIKTQVAGFRYFNVYGPREQHKGSMASVAFHFNNQIKANGELKIFKGCDGYADGEQLRDFIYVNDVVKVNLFFMDNQDKSGIFNVGTGRAQSFNDVAKAVVNFHNKGHINYIDFPEHLKGRYQSYTQADISALRSVGYEEQFSSVSEGVKDYLGIINT